MSPNGIIQTKLAGALPDWASLGSSADSRPGESVRQFQSQSVAPEAGGRGASAKNFWFAVTVRQSTNRLSHSLLGLHFPSKRRTGELQLYERAGVIRILVVASPLFPIMEFQSRRCLLEIYASNSGITFASLTTASVRLSSRPSCGCVSFK